MAGTTSRLSLSYPTGGDNESAFPAVSLSQMTTLDNAVLVTEGVFASRPGVGSVEKDRIYKATDTGVWYVSDGTNWNTMLVAGAWTAISLATNWTATGFTPSVRLQGDQVLFKGAAINNTGAGSNAPFASALGSTFRPAATAYITVSSSSSPYAMQGQVASSGTFVFVTTVANGALAGFDGASFTLS
jgi:hypothetical protein